MGDMADAILNGDDCQMCGCFIGQGLGFPRLCSGCSDEEGDGEGRWAFRRERKKRKNKNAQNDASEFLKNWCEKNGAKFTEIQPWHLSIERNGNRIDIFPNTKKFHHVTKNIRGKMFMRIETWMQQFEK